MSGVPITINNLPTVVPETADMLAAWDNSAGLTGKHTIGALATIFAALTGATFTGNVTAQGIVQSAPVAPGQAFLRAFATDNAAGPGMYCEVGRNSNATTPAPGVFYAGRAASGNTMMWPDDAGIWRTGNNIVVTNANYAAGGSVLGAQSSSLDQKDLMGDAPPEVEEVLAFVAEGAAAVRAFQYKHIQDFDNDGNPIQGPRPYGGEEFSGVIVDYAGRYGTDRDAAHPNGRSLNLINAIGDLLVAVSYLAGRVTELETRMEAAVDGIQAALANFEAQQGGAQ